MAIESIVLPVVDLEPFLSCSTANEECLRQCQVASEAMHKYGAVIIKDPRVTLQHNDAFLDLLESYFDQPEEVLRKDTRPELAYQVGCTPENVETPRCTFDPACLTLISSLKDQPHIPTGADPKWRYFWRVGPRPVNTQFPDLNADEVIPVGFSDQWPVLMNNWGELLLNAVTTLSEMIAIGFGMDSQHAFSALASMGPHLLAPTASNLGKYNQLGTIFAGFHYDLNLLTIHGRSRYPGLSIWTRDGERLNVSVPEGCLLVQAGRQMEYLTGGHVMAGYHEVVVNEGTLKSLKLARKQNRPPWRISSTLFLHVASDQILQPLEQFETPQSLAKYPPILAGLQVQRELESIKLKQ